jgi:hypothetical protein
MRDKLTAEESRSFELGRPAFASLTASTAVTRLKYWRVFVRWCYQRRAPCLPSDEYTIVAYLATLKQNVVRFALRSIMIVQQHYGYALDEKEIRAAAKIRKCGRPKKVTNVT